jgi:hypothetical protein
MAEGDWHVIPTDDLVKHEPDDQCVCVPRAEPVEREDGSVGWVQVHYALDGRDRS